MRLLIAEDDIRLLKSLKHILEKEKYVVDTVSNGQDALEYVLSQEYDGIILDIMMPGIDGIEVLKEIRKRNITTPTLFLTAKTEIYQRVEGLDSGADDYIPKPFSTQELLARIRAMLRRKDSFAPDILCFGNVKLNRSTCELIYNGYELRLSGKEYQIMNMLFLNPRIILTVDQLISHIWGQDSNVEIQTVWVHVSNIRKKLSKLSIPIEIHYIKDAGYILEEIK